MYQFAKKAMWCHSSSRSTRCLSVSEKLSWIPHQPLYRQHFHAYLVYCVTIIFFIGCNAVTECEKLFLFVNGVNDQQIFHNPLDIFVIAIDIRETLLSLYCNILCCSDVSRKDVWQNSSNFSPNLTCNGIVARHFLNAVYLITYLQYLWNK